MKDKRLFKSALMGIGISFFLIAVKHSYMAKLLAFLALIIFVIMFLFSLNLKKKG